MLKSNILLMATITSSLFLLGSTKDTLTSTTIITPEPNLTENVSVPAQVSTVVNTATNQIRSQLTNEWIDSALLNQRPIAVSIPNDPTAIPQYNITNAGVLYQFPVEGKISRMLGIMDEWQSLERIGNVRSAREYFVYAGLEWDPLFCHFGNPYFADAILAAPGTDNINGTKAHSDVFFRSTDRRAPQNAYLSANGIRNGAADKGYSLNYTANHVPNHFMFAPDQTEVDLSAIAGASPATHINLSTPYPVDKPYFIYDGISKEYKRFQYGDAHMDAANNQQLSFKNIIVQKTTVTAIDPNGYLSMAMLDTTKTGFYFTNGVAIPVTWAKTGNFTPTKYYDASGNEIILNTGKTMICVIPDDSSFIYN